MPRSARVKICGVRSASDARMAVDAGARYVGAILSPGFDRSVDPLLAATFLEVFEGAKAFEGVEALEGGDALEGSEAAARVELVAVVVDAGVQGSAAAARGAGAGVIQLHGFETPAELTGLRGEGDWGLWKAVRVRRAEDVLEALDRWAEVADGLLFEGLREGAAGGGGVTFPWEALEAVRSAVPAGLTLVVAGGLGPGNVTEAVRRLSPDVVDVSSGVESSHGVKDAALVAAFARAARLGNTPAATSAGGESGRERESAR